MPVMQPPTGPIAISDPNNVPETFVSGPFGVTNAGGLVHLNFTTARPNPNDFFKGSTKFQATVACRLLMASLSPPHLADTLIKSRPAAHVATGAGGRIDPSARL